MVEIKTLTLTKKIARGLKGELTAKQMGEMFSAHRVKDFEELGSRPVVAEIFWHSFAADSNWSN
jgi:hypothetical protein